jgi:hypothetical protein
MSINQDRPWNRGGAPERTARAAGRSTEPKGASPSGNSPGQDPGQASPLEPFLVVLNVMDRGRREELIGRLSASHDTPDVAQFTRELVRDGLITAYQASAILRLPAGTVIAATDAGSRTEVGGAGKNAWA